MTWYQGTIYLLGCAAIGWHVGQFIRWATRRKLAAMDKKILRELWADMSTERLGDLYVGQAREAVEQYAAGYPALAGHVLRNQHYIVEELESRLRIADRHAKV